MQFFLMQDWKKKSAKSFGTYLQIGVLVTFIKCDYISEVFQKCILS